MSLSDHARAARILAGELAAVASTAKQPVIGELLFAQSAAYHRAADLMEEEDRAEAKRTAAAHRCTIDHAALTTPRCPACGASRG